MYVRIRDGGKCITCGVKKPISQMQAGHFIHNSDKGNKVLGGNLLWYDLRNLNCQCMQCNHFKSGNLGKYAEALEAKYGHGILQELRVLFNTPKKWSKEELKHLIESFKVALGK